ncbi:MAG: hypothetical protein N5P05_003373 [Chroococcopsis gigantea SAG 12.99]|jgi:phosphate transport system substrate-binding protein|nr:DUF4912 domain-containing protein [Chlorogloea purpurea SAG 13.99]MDV3001767.1 hypothetical protein [Chroococcopsis gigantea SAG 12.99]
MHRKKLFPVLSLLLVATTTGLPVSVSLTAQKAIAQAAQSPVTLPKVPDGSTMKIDGAESMEVINQKLKELFGKQYAGTTVDIAKTGTNGAIQEVIDGKIDLAAVGRSLTADEKAKGLVEVPISRYKIAIIVSKDNPFKGDITFEQFAKIFRGEIKNWKELGGADVPIKFIDKPEDNYTRESFKSYPVFENAPFTNGANTVRMKTHETDEMVKALGKDGVGYAVIEQVKDRPDVHIVTMNNVLPTDDRYPFSQPLAYVYKGPNPNPVVKAFLCTANTSEFAQGKEIVSKEFCEETVAAAPVAAEASPSPDTTATAPVTTDPAATGSAQETGGGFSWWLLLLPLIGIPLFFLLKGKGSETVPPAEPVVSPPPPPVPPVRTYNSRISLTPDNCKQGTINWAVDPDQSTALREQGGTNLIVKLFDVTGIDIDRQQPHSVQHIDVTELRGEKSIPIPRDDRDYMAEIGYATPEGGWSSIARSLHSHVPACPPETNSIPSIIDNVGGNMGTGLAAAGAVIGAGAVAAGGFGKNLVKEMDLRDKITITPRTEETASVSWRIDEAEKAALRDRGGETLSLRMHDATDINLETDEPHSTWEHVCNEGEDHLDVPIPVKDKDYVAELGYRTPEGRWLSLGHSNHTHLPGLTEGGLRTGAESLGANISEKFNSVKENLIPDGGFGEIKDNISGAFTNARENLIPEGGFGEIKENIFDAFTSAKENLTADGRIGDATSSIKNNLSSGVAGAGAALGAGIAGLKNWNREDMAKKYGDDHIYITAKSPDSALVNWNVTPEHIQEVKSYGGNQLLLRIYDATGIDLDQQNAHSFQEFECDEFSDSTEIPIPVRGRDYVADLGYVTTEGHWLSIVRSTHTHILA